VLVACCLDLFVSPAINFYTSELSQDTKLICANQLPMFPTGFGSAILTLSDFVIFLVLTLAAVVEASTSHVSPPILEIVLTQDPGVYREMDRYVDME
jgi:hypothetical protein